MAAENGAQGGGGMPDPIYQFEVKRLFPLEIFGIDATFTNSALFMVVGVILSFGLLMYASRGRSLVPNRMQSIAESLYEFVAGMVRDSMGEQGMKFFPLIFTFFMFILTLNMIGMVPGFFTVTSQIWVTAALALLVFVIVIVSVVIIVATIDVSNVIALAVFVAVGVVTVVALAIVVAVAVAVVAVVATTILTRQDQPAGILGTAVGKDRSKRDGRQKAA